MEDLIVKAASRAKKKLITCGKRFATSLQGLEPGNWTRHRNKAILGAIGQTIAPGGSLASALNRSNSWFEPDLIKVPPFGKLLQFIESLATP